MNSGDRPRSGDGREHDQGPDHLTSALRGAALSALLVSDLRAGREPSAQAVSALELDEAHLYAAVVAEVDPAGEFARTLSRSGAADGLPVVQTTIDGWLFALVPGEVYAGESGVTLAQSSRQPIARATAAFAEAEQAFSTARAFGVTGLVDLDQLTPLPFVTATAALARAASSTRFAPLDALGPAGAEVEEAVAALLAHDMSIDETAAALGVHRNTIRARRKRFHQLTGLDIARTTDLVTAWWLLHWRQAQRS